MNSYKPRNKSIETPAGREQQRFRSILEADHTPKANVRRSRFENNQHPTINISANQVQFNNSFCLANIAINNIKTTVKSRERSEPEKPIQKPLQQPHSTTNAQTRVQNLSLGTSQRTKKSYFQINDQGLMNFAMIHPQSETNKSTQNRVMYQKIQQFRNGTMIGTSIDALKDLTSPSNARSTKNGSQKRAPIPELNLQQDRLEQKYKEQSNSLNKKQYRENNGSQNHQKTDESFINNDRTMQTIPVNANKTIDSGDSMHLIQNGSFMLAQVEQNKWENQILPLKPEVAKDMFPHFLTEFEKKEIAQYLNIFYLGHKTTKKGTAGQFNNGYDDEKGDYKYTPHDHIAYRYEILDALGKGSFGSVLKVFDHKRLEESALKIIRSKKKFFNQALVELKVLKFIKDNDTQNQTNIVKIKDYVIFRNHVCIVFELLSINLYEFLKSNHFYGVSLELIRRFAIQILQSLMFLEKALIVHCDLKPENILLKQINKSGIKIVDFGSSCFENERVYTYIQSRFYRAPEVILGLQYSMPIDMWSFGCIMAELFMGFPLFPGESEQEQMQMFMELLGVPQSDFLEGCQRRQVFFTNKQPYSPLLPPSTKGKVRVPGSRDINYYLKCQDETFTNFVRCCFTWRTEDRMKPAEALVHPWILQGLPSEIKLQHLIQMQINAPTLKLNEQIKSVKMEINKSPQKIERSLTLQSETTQVEKQVMAGKSDERKNPILNNYFVNKSKQAQLKINTINDKPNFIQKDSYSTKHAQNHMQVQGPMTSKNNDKSFTNYTAKSKEKKGS